MSERPGVRHLPARAVRPSLEVLRSGDEYRFDLKDERVIYAAIERVDGTTIVVTPFGCRAPIVLDLLSIRRVSGVRLASYAAYAACCERQRRGVFAVVEPHRARAVDLE